MQVDEVLKILFYNRKILAGLASQNVQEIDRFELKAKGYNYSYLTHTMKASNISYFFCFEFGFCISGDKVKIVVNGI